jgi:NADH-quinone oxidoreductase subunit F
VVNNVETLICVPLILERGAEWFAAQGTEKNGGPKLYCISGAVKRPGVYETGMGKITLRQLVFDERFGGGIREGRQLRCVIPGGSSTPVLLPGECGVDMDFDSIGKAGSMLGSAGTIVVDDSTCMVWVARKLAFFYKHESCGKCSPCREGTGWLLRLLDKIEEGKGTERDLEILTTVCDSIAGKTVCAFGDAAATPPMSTLTKFREEYEYHVREKRCWKSVAGTFAEAAALAAGGVGAGARP